MSYFVRITENGRWTDSYSTTTSYDQFNFTIICCSARWFVRLTGPETKAFRKESNVRFSPSKLFANYFLQWYSLSRKFASCFPKRPAQNSGDRSTDYKLADLSLAILFLCGVRQWLSADSTAVRFTDRHFIRHPSLHHTIQCISS